MTVKGFTKSSSPDVLLVLQIKLEQKQSATATNTGGYGYRAYRYGWGGGTTHINIENYVDGMLFINMIDKSTEKLVWQGRGTKTLAENPSPEKKQANITYGVQQIFKNYPPKKK